MISHARLTSLLAVASGLAMPLVVGCGSANDADVTRASTSAVTVAASTSTTDSAAVKDAALAFLSDPDAPVIDAANGDLLAGAESLDLTAVATAGARFDILRLNLLLAQMPNLRALSLAKNALGAAPPVYRNGSPQRQGPPIKLLDLRNARKLTSLDLSHNDINGSAIALLAFEYLRDLTTLDLSHNKIDSFGLRDFRIGLIKKLTNFDLSHNRLGQHGWQIVDFRNAPLLENLNLSHNDIRVSSADDLGGVGDLALLRRLDVSHNHLRDKGVGFLKLSQKNKLEYVDVSGTAMSRDALAALRLEMDEREPSVEVVSTGQQTEGYR